jgi:N-acyl-D-amino-acid deacylase
MLHLPLDFEPGEKFAYSNFGYCLLGRVIEKVSKQRYEAYVKAKVLAPLGLKRMRQGRTLPNLRAKGEVRYHSTAKGPAVLGPQLGKEVPFPYGAYCLEQMDSESGWLGSASDLVNFACAFVDPKKCKVLKPASVESMFARPEGEKAATYYGKGWFVQPWEKGTRSFWHDGAIAGVSGVVIHRANGITFAVLFNTDRAGDADPADVMQRVLSANLKAVFGEK